MSHYYDKDCNPCHFTKGANGKMRDSTLRDARKHGWYPSVTGILDTIAKPGLVNWMINQAVLAALTLPRIDDESDDALIARIRKDGKEEGLRAAERGTEIHDAIEKIWLGISSGFYPSGLYREIAEEAVNEIVIYCGGDIKHGDLIPEQTVVGDGYGGKVDLHNDDFCIDYKTKIITDEQWGKYEAGKDPKIAYPEMAMQLAAYTMALGRTFGKTSLSRRLINVFVDRNIAGRVIIHEWKPEEAEKAWKQFQLLVQYWRLSKNYFPGE